VDEDTLRLVQLQRQRLGELERRRDAAQAELFRLNEEVAAVRGFVDFYMKEAASTKAPPAAPEVGVVRGAVYGQVDNILAEGRKMTADEVRQELMNRFKTEYGRSTVYRALDRGKQEKKYHFDGRLWQAVGF
jgi:hypothetical protein